jgi:predicted nucleic acid-binding protein
MNAAVCDASVLFKLTVAETDSDKAEALIRSTRISIPEFAFLEVANGLWSRVRRGDISAEEATRLLVRLLAIRFDVRSVGEIVQRALTLGTTIDHPVYDCAYLALAESLGIPLVTADQRFLTALRRLDLRVVEVKPLAAFA